MQLNEQQSEVKSEIGRMMRNLDDLNSKVEQLLDSDREANRSL